MIFHVIICCLIHTFFSEGEEGFSALPMNDKLAALVGLHSLSGMENENGSDVEKAEKNDLIARLFNNPVQVCDR